MFNLTKLIQFCPLIIVLISASAYASPRSSRGYIKTKLKSYPSDANKSFGQLFQLQLENNYKFNDNISLFNQLRSLNSSFSDDVSTKYVTTHEDRFDLFPGENYLKLSTDKIVLQAGYQEVIWGEAFGLYYADFITPRDSRETMYSDVSESRLPLLLINSKYFFNLENLSGSLQVLYCPEPRFNKQLPLDLFAGELFPLNNIEIKKEQKKYIFTESEWGGKLSFSLAGHDVSLYTYQYFDRTPYYTLNSMTSSTLKLDENHAPIKSSGFSYAKTIYDFVLRGDIVQTQNKKLNFYENQQLKDDKTNVLEGLISLDSPTYNNFSGLIIFGQSTLSNSSHNYFRDQKEQYLITKISKTLENDNSIDFSYTREFLSSGNGLQTQFNIPLNNTLEMKMGAEFYLGPENSNFNKLKKINNIFISFKSFFQI